MRSIVFDRFLAAVLAALMCLGSLPLTAAAEKAAKGSQVSGVILEGGKPAAGVTIVLTPLESRGTVRTVVTGNDGHYTIGELAHGLYEVAFTRGDSVWASNRVLLVSPSKKLEANFDLGPFLPQDKAAGLEAGQKVAGAEKGATGVARLQEKLGPSGMKWLRTGKGVAVLVGAGALVVGLLIAAGSKSSDKTPSVSASTP